MIQEDKLETAPNPLAKVSAALEQEDDELKKLVQDLFSLLDSVEESDGGNLFSPTYITSCRTFHVEKLRKILPRLRELVGLTPKRKETEVMQ